MMPAPFPGRSVARGIRQMVLQLMKQKGLQTPFLLTSGGKRIPVEEQKENDCTGSCASSGPCSDDYSVEPAQTAPDTHYSHYSENCPPE
jgi:hypothetical protein